jgi:serine/threonine-protein kinase RsbW
MAELANVRLDLSNRPENVMLVREMLSGVAETIDLKGSDLNDIRTAVTEACNNVVLHAYEGQEGPLEIEVHLTSSALEVVVRDRGVGIRAPNGDEDRQTGTAEQTGFGIGLPVIRALVHRVEFSNVAGSGTEVRMEFATPPRSRAFAPLKLDDRAELPMFAQTALGTTALVTIAPPRLARTVLPRMLSVLAARAHFSTDRISDTQLLADALLAHADGEESSGAGHLNVAVNVKPRDLELHVGPFDAGCARGLVADSNLAGMAPVIERLTDHHHIAAVGTSEMLTLRLADRR